MLPLKPPSELLVDGMKPNQELRLSGKEAKKRLKLFSLLHLNFQYGVIIQSDHKEVLSPLKPFSVLVTQENVAVIDNIFKGNCAIHGAFPHPQLMNAWAHLHVNQRRKKKKKKTKKFYLYDDQLMDNFQILYKSGLYDQQERREGGGETINSINLLIHISETWINKEPPLQTNQ